MATNRKHTLSHTFYFVTFTCFKWLNLFEVTNIYNFLPKSINHLAAKGFKNCGFVVMPNHMHLLLFAEGQNDGLNKTLSGTKRFLAYEVIRKLKAKRKTELLRVLSEGVTVNEAGKGKKHRVFRHSFDAKPIDDREELIKVLDYMHFNPCQGKWMLAPSYLDYPYSSAAFYELEKKAFIPIWDYREFTE